MPGPKENFSRHVPPAGAEQPPDLEYSPSLPENSRHTFDQALNTTTWEDALHGESYEVANRALGEVRSLRQWRHAAKGSRFKDFYTLFEQLSQIEKGGVDRAEHAALRDELIGELSARAHGQSPRVADLYLGLISEIEGTPYTPQFESTTEKIQSLKDSGDLSVLVSANVPFEAKLNRFQTRLEDELSGRRALDKRDGKQEEEIEKIPYPDTSPPTPPPASDESKPGMDEMERSPEGEMPPAIWTISPAWGGYYKQQSFDTWDASSNTWRQSKYEYEEVVDLASVPHGDEEALEMAAAVSPGRWTRLNVPYTHELIGITAQSGEVHIRRDQNGDYVFLVDDTDGELLTVQVTLANKEKAQMSAQDRRLQLPTFSEGFSEETLAQIEQIERRKKGNLPRAWALSRLVMQRLKYSNDSSFNAVYESHPQGYIGGIDEHRQADCDVANTYFAALCAQLHIPARHVTGHMVKGKDNEGNSRITSGTGHAWTEIWDEVGLAWVRVDATPPGDPQQEQEQQESESVPGDYGSQEEIGPTDEQLRELEEKLAERTEELQFTQEERELAEATGIELKEARDIVREIAEVEETKLPNGEKIVDVLAKLFSLIIESRRTSATSYTGPLRRREGGEHIDDIVVHKIGMAAGETDPVSRQKEIEVTKPEQVFGGFDLYIVGDKSGSMSNTVDGEEKWRLQRRAQYLILSSLYRFEQSLKAAQVHMKDPLSVRTQAISFRDSKVIDVDKPLSNTFTPEDKVGLWRSLGNQGSGNGDVAALSLICRDIGKERQAIENAGGEDNRLRMVIACSDGYPDDVAGVRREAEALGKQNSVVVGIGLTETAVQVPVIFNTPYSRGDIARDMNDLPIIVAKHLVQEAVKLFPERSRLQFMPYLESVIRKFDSLG